MKDSKRQRTRHADKNSSLHIKYFMQRLKFCGYSTDFRHKVLQKAIRLYDARKKNVLEGKSYYELNDGSASEENKHDWYKEGDKNESVLFVEATPRSEYKEKVEVLVKKYDLKIKVVERVGQTIKKMLQRSDPFRRNICERRDCIICTKGFNINCRERGCVYQFCCLECEQKRKYRGQTGRSIYHRTGEHMKNWDKDLHFYPLKRHSDIFHGGNSFEFEIEILSRCYGKPS